MKTDFEKARDAYELAWGEAKRTGDEALETLKLANQVSGIESRKLFRKRAKEALKASENWQKAARLAVKLMDETLQRRDSA